jgi:hypothetical protein
MVNDGLAAFDKCLADLAAKYAEWKAKFYKAFGEYQSCLIQIDEMLLAWRAKGECNIAPCDMMKMRGLAAEGHIRHRMLKQLMVMGVQVAMMHTKCCMHIQALQAMINWLDSRCPMPCNLQMYQGNCAKVAIPTPPPMPTAASAPAPAPAPAAPAGGTELTPRAPAAPGAPQ